MVLNHSASAALSEKFAPVLARVPAVFQAAPQLQQLNAVLASNPQSLFQMLLLPKAQEALPVPLRAPIVNALKEALATSIQSVFLVGLGLVVLGALSGFLMGRARLVAAGEESSGEVGGDPAANEV